MSLSQFFRFFYWEKRQVPYLFEGEMFLLAEADHEDPLGFELSSRREGYALPKFPLQFLLSNGPGDDPAENIIDCFRRSPDFLYSFKQTHDQEVGSDITHVA